MPEYSTSEVFIEEVARDPRPIEGLPTSTAAFLGETERGTLRPRLVTSAREYARWFGGAFHDARYMPYAVRGFFENGGKRLYVCRLVGARATVASRLFGEFIVESTGPGAWGRNVWVRIQESTPRNDAEHSARFRLTVAYWASPPHGFAPFDPLDPGNDGRLPRPQLVEDYDHLSIDPDSPDAFETRLSDAATTAPTSALVCMRRTVAGTRSLPPMTDPNGVFLDGGADETDALGVDDVTGDVPQDAVGGGAGRRTEPQGLAALDALPLRDFTLIHAPHTSDNWAPIARALIDYCERSRSAFSVIDLPDIDPRTLDPRVQVQETSHGACYAPWLNVVDPDTGRLHTVPPGGFVLGVYARVDSARGVFKPPANEVVRGALGVQVEIDARINEILNQRGVNVIRRFPDRGIVVWGARTLTTESTWKYVSVRRLLAYLEHSIAEGLSWVVFEPNDEPLWSRVAESARTFLRAEWRAGAFGGRTEAEAFFIRCDRTTMTDDDILNGRLVAEVGVAPLRPAEFIVLRLEWRTPARNQARNQARA